MKNLKLLPIKTLSLIICSVFALSASAYDFEQNGIYYTASGTNATVTYKNTNYNTYSGTVNIPATVTNNGTTYTVTTIGYQAFLNCPNLKRVVMPNTINYISNLAFKGCSGLTNITIPASLATIYSSVFQECTSLKSVICLTTHVANDNNVGNNCFSATTYENATLYVPSGSSDTFRAITKCWGQFSNIMEMTCDFAEDAIFYDDLGNNHVAVTSVARFADSYSGEVVIPSSVTHDGTTFTVTSIATEGFWGNLELTSVSLPSTVNEINIYAFYDCRKLTKVNIPDGVADINYCAFGSCYALQSITIPASVNWIAQNAFTGCDALTSVTCKATTPPICTDHSCFTSAAYSNAALYVPSNAVAQYQQADVWQDFSNIVGKDYDIEANGIYYVITGPNTASVTYRDRNFNSYSGTVNIPATVTHNGATYTVTAIGNSAFCVCDELTQVTIPNTVTSIDYAAFYRCSSLTSLTIPNSVVSIGEHALRESGITSISIPNSVTSLGNMCFQQCSALQSATLGTGITEIPQQCFTYCEALTSINFGSNVKTIGPYAFYLSGLTSVSVPEGVETIDYCAFAECPNLTSISFPSSVLLIDDLALDECPALATITVSNANPNYCAIDNILYNKQMTRLIRYAPQIPTRMAVVPNTCVEIDMKAFCNASNLDYINIGPNVEQIGNLAFTNCYALKAFYIPEENTHFTAPDGVLFTKANGVPQKIIQYPICKPDKHYSLPNTTDTIALCAFENTSLLESVYIPSSVKAMASEAFASSSVKRVVIDEGLKSITNYVFHGCLNLESIYLPSTIEYIGYQAFFYALNLSEITIAVDGEAPIIGEQAFYGLAYNTDNRYATVYVPSGMASQYAGLNDWLDARGNFTDISPVTSGTEFTVDSLTYVTTDNDLNAKVSGVTSKSIFDPGIPPKVAYTGNLCTVTALDKNSFQNCTRMVRADVPFTVSLIDGYAFYGCTNLKEVKLNEGLRTIGSFAFAHDKNITDIDIPASVDSIMSGVFNYDPSIKSIDVDPNNRKYTHISYVLYSKDRKRLIAFPEGLTTEYNVPKGTEAIGSSAFRGNASLTNIQLPESLRLIDKYAFYECTKLTDIVVPLGTKTVDRYAFLSCSSLTTVELPSTLEQLGYHCFYNTANLTTIKVKATTPPVCETYRNPRTGELYEPFDETHYNNATLIVPKGCKAAYQAANVWNKFINIVEEDFPVPYLRGDVNDDGIVDVSDVTAIISYVLGNTNSNFNFSAGDANEDGVIDVSDVTMVIAYVLGTPWPESKGVDMWYLCGDYIGSSPWNNMPDAIGTGLVPMYPVGQFNSTGKGTLTYTGVFLADGWIMLIHTPGDWDDKFGQNAQGEFGYGSGYDAFRVPSDGYYTFTFNTVTGELTIEPYTGSQNGYNAMTMPGGYEYWVVTDESNNMVPINTRKTNHNWMRKDFTVTHDTELKFAADNDWENNWGTDEFPYGKGLRDGMNIPVKAGTYDVYFNDLTGRYNFIKKN